MNTESQRTLIAIIRKVVFAGIVIMLAWLVLLGLRGAISINAIADLNQSIQQSQGPNQPAEVSLNPWSWDWSKSIWTGDSVAGKVGSRLGSTLGFIAVTAVFSVILALIFLLVGKLITKITGRPGWLTKTRGILRLLIICFAVSAPIFAWETLVAVYPSVWWGMAPESPWAFVINAYSAAILPAWLLVQYGHGEMANGPESTAIFDGSLWKHLSISLAIRILKLVGAIVVISVFVGLATTLSGMSRIFVDAISRRDFPLIYGIVFALIVIVVIFKLAADLLEIAYRRYHQPAVSAPASNRTVTGFRVPRWLIITAVALVAVSILVAIFAPLIAPYGYNEMTLNDRLLPPSSAHILGTDNLGRDVFSRLLWGIRIDIFLGLISGAIVIALAAGWSILGAHVRRSDDWQGDTMEDIVMLPRDVLYAVPWLIMLYFLTSLILISGSGELISTISPVVIFATIALLPRVIGLVQEAYHNPPLGRGWLGSVLTALPVAFFFAVAGAIMYTAAISYQGFGVPPPAPELGGMLAGPARRYMLQAPWMALWPPLTLVLLMMAWVLAGESLLERIGFRSRALWSKIWE